MLFRPEKSGDWLQILASFLERLYIIISCVIVFIIHREISDKPDGFSCVTVYGDLEDLARVGMEESGRWPAR